MTGVAERIGCAPHDRGHPDRVNACRVRAARERALWIREAWDHLTDFEQATFAAFAVATVSAGQPVPPFTTYAAEAADWAHWASPQELVVYAAACLIRIPKTERRRLWASLRRAGA